MLEIVNTTAFETGAALLVDLDCSDIWVVAIKATYAIKGGDLSVAESQAPVCLVDEYYGEPGESGMKYENELVFRKPGTDVVVNGHAYAPSTNPTHDLEVSLSVDGRSKAVRVYGDRFWRDAGFGIEMTEPEPFAQMPLVWERSFGGIDLSDPDPRNRGAEHRNPLGTGFAMKAATLVNQALPNLEDPEDEIRSWKQRPQPAGFGFICKHWEPRRRYTGTCDQNYIETRLPFYPVDFDIRFFLGAAPGLSFTPHLKGGEAIRLRHMTPDGDLRFRLPRVTLGLRTYIDGRWLDHRAVLGTVIIEPDAQRVMLVWHSHLSCHRKKFRIEETRIFEKEYVT